MACVIYISLISLNILIQINSFVFYQIYYSKMIKMHEDDVLYGAKGWNSVKSIGCEVLFHIPPFLDIALFQIVDLNLSSSIIGCWQYQCQLKTDSSHVGESGH